MLARPSQRRNRPPEAAVAVAPFGVPLRLGAAVPLAPALREGDAGLTAGALLRVTAELDQD